MVVVTGMLVVLELRELVVQPLHTVDVVDDEAVVVMLAEVVAAVVDAVVEEVEVVVDIVMVVLPELELIGMVNSSTWAWFCEYSDAIDSLAV
jgi:hypothetical protein